MHPRARIVVNNPPEPTGRAARWRLFLLSPGSGHLHGEAGGPVLHLGLLPADPAQRLRPRPGDLLQHRVHQVSQEDGLLHG